MAQFRTFEEIKAWQKSRLLIHSIRAICKKPDVKRDFPFTDQITRAARSVSANIAEGNDAMTTNEFIHYLGIAKRSAGEVRSHLYDALDEQYISRNEFDQLAFQSREIAKMLASLIHHLQSFDPEMKRTFKKSI